MVGEEKAEKYANEKHCKKCINFAECVESAIDDRCEIYQESYKDYLNGLAEGKPKWHDLREDPNDLPPEEYPNSSFSINVFTDTEDKAFYSYHANIWVRESDSFKIPKVVAWCELPRFKE